VYSVAKGMNLFLRISIVLTGLVLVGVSLLTCSLSNESNKIERISINRLLKEESGLIKPGNDILPFNIEIGMVGKGDSLPKTKIEIGKEKITLTKMEDFTNIITYEQDIAATKIPRILLRYKPEDFKGGYSIVDDFIRDGGYTLIKSSSCYYRFYLWNLNELPREFVKFRPLLEEIYNIIENRSKYKIIKSEPFVK
jgi:hypothetical protein